MGAEVKAETAARQHSFYEIFKMISSLFKMRVVSLLLFASLGGAFLGHRGVPSAVTLAVLLVTGMLAASGASAINQYLERDIDPRMRRTQRRPLASGQIQHPTAILGIAVAMILVAVFSVLPANPTMAFYLALGALIYVGIYTMWLKPRSVLNIVIGGAAGSCAVMTGGAAVGAASDPAVVVLALLVFLWTPAHFWALAMMYKDDYAAAHVPMLPVHASQGSTAWWIFVHAASTGLAALVLAVTPALGWLYIIPTGIMTFLFLAGSVRLIRTPDRKHAVRLFVTSNIFLALVLLAILVAATSHQFISLPRG
jgi:protoheme IX farnesyltransferase